MVHIGIIPDGNRRWAASNNVAQYSVDIVMNYILEKYKDIEKTELQNLKLITEVTFYILTVENLERQDNTVPTVYKIIEDLANMKFGDSVTNHIISTYSIQFIGSLEKLPDHVVSSCNKIKNVYNKGPVKLHIAIAYDAIEDSRRVLNNDPSRPEQSKIDLVIRTGGEFRSSGFFPLHTLYSEWIYLSKYFPDFTMYDIDECVSVYLKRSRRYGK